MKNLKIGAKILLGFGVVLALMVVIAVTVVFSSTTTMTNVESVDNDSALQTKSNELMVAFYEARIQANILYSIISDEAYDSFTQKMAECDAKLADVYTHISQNPNQESFRPGFQAFEESAKNWQAGVDNVQRDNQSLIGVTEQAVAVGVNLDETSTKAFSDQLALLRASGGEELSPDGINSSSARLESAEKISSGIGQIRMKFRIMLDSFDISEYDALVNLVDETVNDVNNYKNLVTQQAHKDTAQDIIESLELYKTYITDFVSGVEEAEATMASTRPIGLETLDKLSAVLADVDEAMGNQLDDTISTASSSLIMVIVISVVSVISSIILAFAIKTGITKPVNNMRDCLVNMGTTGNLILDPDALKTAMEEAKSKDEVGQCSNALMGLIAHLEDASKNLARVADGDLTVKAKLLSENDSMGLAIDKMVSSLNRMFSEINNATAQVSTGANQIADGAQVLAQGSTEQAAATQELSASISEVSGKTKDNASLAGRAAMLANDIKGSAEKGSRQMDEMMQAVKEINEASQSISKVIKVIDDIAFQTNILALNAAVEAARAGQQGKGFAVVAEEVRNLAAKSAEAAKDTESLIANSMEKAELGARIADETAASLVEIVAGINESSQIVGDIAHSSEDQSVAIDEINKGIDQVAQVVQQNSATAEQSAAASEEMSSQSVMLKELAAQFKLKDDNLENEFGNEDTGKETGVTAAQNLDDFGKY